jgi:uncharacterized protein YhdP
MSKRFRTSILSIFLFALAVMALLALPALFYLSKLDEAVVRMIEDALQKKVVVGDIRVSLDQGLGFRLDHLSIFDREGEQEILFSAERLFVGLDLRSLIRGRIRIQRVYGYRPKIFVTRDASGEINLTRLYSPRYVQENLPGGLETHPFAHTFGPLLWKNRIDLEAGEIQFRDARLQDPTALSVKNLHLHMNSRLLRDELHVEISGEVVKPLAGGTYSLTGNIRSWKEARSLAALQVDLNLAFQNVSLESLSGYLPPKVRGRKLAGSLSGLFAYEGALLLPGRANLTLNLQAPVWDNPHVHTKVLAPDSVMIQASGEIRRDQVLLDPSEIRLGGLRIRAEGGLLAQKGPFSFLDLHLSGKDLPLLQAMQYLPLGLLRSKVWPFLVDMTQGGNVDARADLVGDLPDFSHMDTPQGENSFKLRLDVRDMTVVLPVGEPYLPFRSVRGTLELTDGELRFQDFSAYYGKAFLRQANGSIRDIHKSKSQLDIIGNVNLDFPEAVRELDHGIMPDVVREVSRQVHQPSGKGNLKIQVLYDYGSDVEERIRIVGKTSLDSVKARYGSCPLPFEEVGGTVEFTESSLRDLDIGMLIGNTPARIRGQIHFGEMEGEPRGEIRWTSDRLDTTDLLALFGKDKVAEGILPGQGTVQLHREVSSWDATLGPGDVTFSGDRHIFPLTGLRLSLANDGNSTEIREASFQVLGNSLACRGQLRSLSPLAGKLEITSPALNLDSLLQQKKPAGPLRRLLYPEQKTESAWNAIDLNVALDLGRFSYRAFSLEQLRGRGAIAKGKIRLEDLRAGLGAGNVSLLGEASKEQDRFPFSLQFSLEQIPSEDLIRWLNGAPGFLQGPATLQGDIRGTYDPHSRWSSSLSGNVTLESSEGVIQRYDLLAKILTLVNVTQWSKIRLGDLQAKGIPYRSIQGLLHIENGTLSTENLQVDSNIALANLNGTYDFLKDHMGLLLSLRPMEQLDQVLDLLPVVGKVVQGPDGTIVIFYYRLEGPLKNPEVTLIPFKSLNGPLWNIPVQELNRWLQAVEEAFLGFKESGAGRGKGNAR